MLTSVWVIDYAFVQKIVINLLRKKPSIKKTDTLEHYLLPSANAHTHIYTSGPFASILTGCYISFIFFFRIAKVEILKLLFWQSMCMFVLDDLGAFQISPTHTLSNTNAHAHKHINTTLMET
jgi:hypothetical protein